MYVDLSVRLTIIKIRGGENQSVADRLVRNMFIVYNIQMHLKRSHLKEAHAYITNTTTKNEMPQCIKHIKPCILQMYRTVVNRKQVPKDMCHAVRLHPTLG